MELVLFTSLLITAFLLLVVSVLYYLSNKSRKQNENARNEFMSVMIHELRSPLAVIKSSADMILKEAANLTQQQITVLLSQMEQSAVDMLGLVNNLLDMSKIEAGKVELFKHKTNISELLRSEAEYFERLAKEKRLTVSLDLDYTLAPIDCDPEKIKHIITNLISNAIKYTEDGGITISSAMVGEFIQITVADTGIGIPDDVKARLFTRYTRGSEEARKTANGTGLGLVIVKGIVEAHGGKVWVENNEPHGSKFVFTLPAE